MSRSRFGSIRRRSSGRYAATYRHRGIEYRATMTFANHADGARCPPSQSRLADPDAGGTAGGLEVEDESQCPIDLRHLLNRGVAGAGGDAEHRDHAELITS